MNAGELVCSRNALVYESGLYNFAGVIVVALDCTLSHIVNLDAFNAVYHHSLALYRRVYTSVI